ncbi:hypothetical protein PoMZ_13196 [Pyricularia oryzae]|uniref:Uncharacterized protein n=1 Tax=Pyricularia oryzae TaxID=318829 RepID=A0A4P7NUS5_PYROR|nr:hypothetical protein PoMZ_13196 [Pyricularia oryzae]
MKFSATLFTAIATTSVQALWFVPSSHSENKHQLREYLTTPAGLKDFATEEHGVDVSKQCCERATFPEFVTILQTPELPNFLLRMLPRLLDYAVKQPALLCREQSAPDDDQLGHDNRVRDIKIRTLERGTLLKKKQAKAVLIRLGYKK